MWNPNQASEYGQHASREAGNATYPAEYQSLHEGRHTSNGAQASAEEGPNGARYPFPAGQEKNGYFIRGDNMSQTHTDQSSMQDSYRGTQNGSFESRKYEASKPTTATEANRKVSLSKAPSTSFKVAKSGPRLAFGFKSTSRVKATVNPLKAALESDELEAQENERQEEAERDAKRQKLGIAPPSSESSARAPAAPPSAPEDPEVRRIAEKLAKFVAKNGRGLENTTRQRNPGDTPFRFLFDTSATDYKYYEYCVGLEEKALQESSAANQEQEASRPGPPPPAQAQAQPPERRRTGFLDTPPAGRAEPAGPSTTADDKLSQEDSLAKMEFYARQAARANASREPKADIREMPPVADTSREFSKRGHHMGDFIPEEELQTFMAKSTGSRAPPAEDRNKIGASNVGHKLLSKMGWTEGSGLGAGGSGMVDPLAAGGTKLDGLGVGAAQTHEPTTTDDIYEQYKKRMMLGYKHRPNPLGNPRKAYY